MARAAGTVTTTATTTTIRTERLRPAPPMTPAPHSLLQLLWLASPALPVGGFSYSEGLEAAIEHGQVQDEATLAAWVLDQLHLAQARSDMPALAHSVQAWQAGDAARVRELNDWVLQTRESAELRLQSVQMGRSLAEWLRNLHGRDAERSAHIALLHGLPPTYPVAFGLAGAYAGAAVRDVVLAYAFAWAENMVQAALKSMRLGQSAGQRVLSRLAAAIPDATDHALAQPDAARQAFSPMLAILSARHETQYSRLFRS